MTRKETMKRLSAVFDQISNVWPDLDFSVAQDLENINALAAQMAKLGAAFTGLATSLLELE